MEMNEENLQALTTYLQQTMSPDINLRKPAEDFLKSVEGQHGYAMLLLAMLGTERQVAMDIKLAAAIAFKNFIKRNWKVVSIPNLHCQISIAENTKHCLELSNRKCNFISFSMMIVPIKFILMIERG